MRATLIMSGLVPNDGKALGGDSWATQHLRIPAREQPEDAVGSGAALAALPDKPDKLDKRDAYWLVARKAQIPDQRNLCFQVYQQDFEDEYGAARSMEQTLGEVGSLRTQQAAKQILLQQLSIKISEVHMETEEEDLSGDDDNDLSWNSILMAVATEPTTVAATQ